MKYFIPIFVFAAAVTSSVEAFLPHSTTRANQWGTTSTKLRMSAEDFKDVKVMVNGMPGPMATSAAEACLRKGLDLSPIALTGPDIEPCTITVADKVTERYANVKLVPASNMEEFKKSVEELKEKCGPNNLLAIDFTHPSAVNGNALFYADNNIPFVMGTTGGDREKLMSDMEEKKAFAVIAPNMAKQIVALQAGLEDLAKKYPGAFEGYQLTVKESHQKTKADTSGTAKAVVESLEQLSTCGFTVDDIELVRDDEESIAFGVPEDALNGHAFHTYTLTSADGSVEFQLKHNVAGRSVYAEGTADAVKFLAKKLRTEETGKIFSMINVLEEGALE
uniref:4-hydroxy-tetrahydrodipicolinate reductase n=1 Tax=Ditylum brightwellii TaxID=49249 RepID=A0A6U3NYN1_9STRA|mmetsp:Transcript_30652/g.45076  ORF Transcript_30652/g.45076 Transcript_30652/m.45076 type:complete len:335 (+) Transcript_30652:213-1217(+)